MIPQNNDDATLSRITQHLDRQRSQGCVKVEGYDPICSSLVLRSRAVADAVAAQRRLVESARVKAQRQEDWAQLSKSIGELEEADRRLAQGVFDRYKGSWSALCAKAHAQIWDGKTLINDSNAALQEVGEQLSAATAQQLQQTGAAKADFLAFCDEQITIDATDSCMFSIEMETSSRIDRMKGMLHDGRENEVPRRPSVEEFGRCMTEHALDRYQLTGTAWCSKRAPTAHVKMACDLADVVAQRRAAAERDLRHAREAQSRPRNVR